MEAKKQHERWGPRRVLGSRLGNRIENPAEVTGTDGTGVVVRAESDEEIAAMIVVEIVTGGTADTMMTENVITAVIGTGLDREIIIAEDDPDHAHGIDMTGKMMVILKSHEQIAAIPQQSVGLMPNDAETGTVIVVEIDFGEGLVDLGD